MLLSPSLGDGATASWADLSQNSSVNPAVNGKVAFVRRGGCGLATKFNNVVMNGTCMPARYLMVRPLDCIALLINLHRVLIQPCLHSEACGDNPWSADTRSHRCVLAGAIGYVAYNFIPVGLDRIPSPPNVRAL